MFLAETAAVVPWDALGALIAPHYHKIGPQGGRRPYPRSTMLRNYSLQQWYSLSDPSAEEVLYDIQSMREFAGLELARDAIPDETTIFNFRHLLERHDLTKAIFAVVVTASAAAGMTHAGAEGRHPARRSRALMVGATSRGALLHAHGRPPQGSGEQACSHAGLGSGKRRSTSPYSAWEKLGKITC